MIRSYFILLLALCQWLAANSQQRKAKWIPGTAPTDSIIVPSGLLVNHAGVRYALLTDIAAYVGSETDPVFAASAAAAISSGDIASWNAKQPAITGTGLVKSSGGTISYITDNSSNWNNAALTTGSYANPSWITSLAWTKITGTPTSLSGYGITDAAPLSGGANYIQNQSAGAQSTASYWVSGTGRTGSNFYAPKIIINNGTTDNGLGVLQVTGDIWTSGSITLKSASYTGGLTIAHTANATVALSNPSIGTFMTAGPGNYVTFPQNYISVKGIINGNTGAFPWYFGASNANGMTWDAANSINNSGGNNNYYMAFTVSPNMQQANTIYDLIRFTSTITFNANSSGITKVRGIYFNPTVTNGSALPTGQIVIPFENVLGNNYLNSSSGNTGIGYASGAALSEKLSVSGNVAATYFIGSMQPTSMADGSAPNNTVYYSTTQSKLVYKDASGVVNILY